MRARHHVLTLACLALAACMAVEPPVAPLSADGANAAAGPAFSAGPAARAARARATMPAAGMPPVDAVGPLDDPLTCLARTVYWESKGQPVEGQAAVAHVVLNRARADGYPSGVCEVVTHGGPTRPCQFHFYCDGRDDTPQEPDAYRTAHRVAWEALTGASEDPTAGATMFHNRRVRPGWASASRRTAVIGDHSFYR